MIEDQDDYRATNAREGKAIYVPGKTPRERAALNAKAAAHEAQLSSREITLTNQQWSDLDTAIPDLIEAFHDIGSLHSHLAYEGNLDALWINAVMRLTSRAVRSMEEKEIAILDRLDVVIRHADKGGN